MEVAAVEKLNSLPVSTSVIPTLYSLMIPLGKGGGDQARENDDGDNAVDTRFSGGLLGARMK